MYYVTHAVPAPIHCPDAFFIISELLLFPAIDCCLISVSQIANLPKHQPAPPSMLLSIVLLSLTFKC